MALIDMDEVVNLIHEAGISAYVEQTGGGCATIYAGTRYVSREAFGEVWGSWASRGKFAVCERWAAVAGPGYFEGPHFAENPRGTTEDFFVGIDDGGESPNYYATTDADDERTIANRLVNIARVANVVLAMAGYVPTTEEEN